MQGRRKFFGSNSGHDAVVVADDADDFDTIIIRDDAMVITPPLLYSFSIRFYHNSRGEAFHDNAQEQAGNQLVALTVRPRISSVALTKAPDNLNTLLVP